MLIRRLGLDQLSAVDRAFRSQVLAQALSSVRSNLRSFAGRYELDDELVDTALKPYSDRHSLIAEATSFADALSAREWRVVGLHALANQAKALLMERHRNGGAPSQFMERDLLPVAAKSERGSEGGSLGRR